MKLQWANMSEHITASLPLSPSLPLLSPAQWKVHVRKPGVIALQNMHTPAHWLAIRDGKTIGNVCKPY